MSTPEEALSVDTNPPVQSKSNKTIVILLVIIILLLCAVLAVFLLRRDSGPAQSAATDDTDGAPKLSYASDGVIALGDADTLQAAVDKAMENAKNGRIALDYKNVAVSTDGKVFSCHLGNSPENAYDMYVDIYSDIKFTNQLFLSGLIRPGEAFDSIELNQTLEPGSHKVYCAFTQVEEDLSTIHGQIIVALTLSVSK